MARLVRVGALLQLRAAVISCSHARIGDKTIEGRGCGTIGVIKNKIKSYWSWHASGAQELCECRGERPGLPVPNGPYGLVDIKQEEKKASGHQCVKVDMAVLGSLSLISLVVSVDVKQH